MNICEEITKIIVGRDVIEITKNQEMLQLTFNSVSGNLNYTFSFNEIEYEKLSKFKKKNIVEKIRVCTFENLKTSFYEKHPYLVKYKDTRHVLFRLKTKTGISGMVVSKKVEYSVMHSKKGEAVLQKGMKERVKERLAEDPNFYKEHKYFEIRDKEGNKLPFPEGLYE